MRLAHQFEQLIVRGFCLGITVYQHTMSPDHGMLRRPWGYCRFYPSCSQYALDALRKKGLWQGIVLAVKRVGRCNPFHEPGYDPVS